MTVLAVVGTDTGVGKTTVTAGLARALLSRGRQPAVFKPVETGVLESSHTDARTLALASGQQESETLGVAYPLPAAPLAAAREAGETVPLDRLELLLERLKADFDPVLLEGAGGLLVPFADNILWADLLSRWRAAAVVVGRLGLGSINHTLLTLSELRRRGITPWGVVLCSLEPSGPESHLTPGLIEEFGDIDIIVTVAHGVSDPRAIEARLTETRLLERITSRCRSG